MTAVWITRPVPGCRRTAEALGQAGYRVVVVPLLEVRVVDPDPIPSAWPDWLVLVSRNAGEGIEHALGVRGFPKGKKDQVKVASVGRVTADWAKDRGWFVELVPEKENASGLVEGLSRESLAQKRIWVPSGNRKGSATETLPQALQEWGATVEVFQVYETAARRQSREDLRALGSVEPGAVVLHSPSAAEALLAPEAPPEVRLWRESARVVSIGPATTERCRNLGESDVLECAHPSDHDLAEALGSIEALSRKETR